MSSSISSSVTDEQWQQIAEAVKDTNKDVFPVYERIVGHSPIGVAAYDDVFDTLDKQYGIFKCLECEFWLDIKKRYRGIMNICNPCEEADDF